MTKNKGFKAESVMNLKTLSLFPYLQNEAKESILLDFHHCNKMPEIIILKMEMEGFLWLTLSWVSGYCQWSQILSCAD